MVLRVIDEPLDQALTRFKPPALQTHLTQTQACDLAVMMGYQGLGHVSPNPLVGAVILDPKGRLLGTGAHRQHGGAHAEIDAMKDLSPSQLQGATICITLEPCSIEGHTPACAPRLAQQGFAKIFFGAIDPHPKVSGRGVQILHSAGVHCEHLLEWNSDCERLAEIFMHNCRTGQPFVAVKVASGLDGNVAHVGDQRRWITGERARQYGHFLRSYYDGILVGRGTVEADDPLLDARYSLTGHRSPRRIVLDPQARLANPARQYKIFAKESQEPTLWFVATDRAAVAAKAHPHAEICPLPAARNGFEFPLLLQEIYQRGVRSVMIEGGPTTTASALGAGIVDRLHVFQAASIAGGPQSLNWSQLVSEKTDIRLEQPELTILGEDWLITTRTSERGKGSR